MLFKKILFGKQNNLLICDTCFINKTVLEHQCSRYDCFHLCIMLSIV